MYDHFYFVHQTNKIKSVCIRYLYRLYWILIPPLDPYTVVVTTIIFIGTSMKIPSPPDLLVVAEKEKYQIIKKT
jgi:hypothetical protein